MPWLGASARSVTRLNLAGDYGYLTTGYYASLDAESEGTSVLPTTAEALDAYVAPIVTDKAQRAGIPVPPSTVVLDRFPPPPFLAWPVNPFRRPGEAILDADALDRRRRGLTHGGKYAVLCQRLPSDHRLDVARVVVGRTNVPELAEFARDLFRVVRLPLFRAHLVVTADAYRLAAVRALPFAELTLEERGWISELGTWRS